MKWGGLMNNESFWDSFLQSINNKVNSISFSTWFADCKLKSMDASSIVIEASTKFKKDFLSQNAEVMSNIETEIRAKLAENA